MVADSTYVFPLHERLSFAQGAALGTPYFTAYKALIMGAQVRKKNERQGIFGHFLFWTESDCGNFAFCPKRRTVLLSKPVDFYK